MRLIYSICLMLFASTATAHEYWIEAEDFALAPGAALKADLKVGQDLSGNRLSYFPPGFVRFDLYDNAGARPVEGRIGDRPALSASDLAPGLTIAALETTPSSLTWSEAETFQAFLDYDGLEWVAAVHRDRGLPAEGFSESYTRYAKALISVGTPIGQDQVTGLTFELVALENPYAFDGPLPVLLLYRGAPKAGTQIALFHRAPDGTVSRELFRTDAAGQAVIPRRGAGLSLLSAVHMEPRAGDPHVWHSLWASLTYDVGASPNS
ncbi:hypothetical protein FHS89_002635 [Rubricella aquisinus]|uniref:DUF4198 domain-containing protein n=1 Tax=Rubricella aquisinus TaxID=2028108 RepID=A0A840X1G8_9RHOB|nr:DUF4198 domain-containing protein [Rubricella aquisinus]MBB5516604.1 hypothetical protein [Rubricella aquisinus]